MFTTRRYTNPRLPYLTLPHQALTWKLACSFHRSYKSVSSAKLLIILVSHSALRRKPVSSLTLFIELEKKRSKPSEEWQKEPSYRDIKRAVAAVNDCWDWECCWSDVAMHCIHDITETENLLSYSLLNIQFQLEWVATTWIPELIW